MLRKITSVFILLAFLLVKGTSLWVSNQEKQMLSHHISDEESEQAPVADKSDKCMEFCDDDFFPSYAFELFSFESAKRINHDAALHRLPIYISSVNPPPDPGFLLG